MNPIAPKPGHLKPTFDISQTTSVECEKCKGTAFQDCVILRRVPALLSDTGKEGFLPLNSFSCSACGTVNQEFLPKELRTNTIKISEITIS
jgi:uncharacterized Zn finger protein